MSSEFLSWQKQSYYGMLGITQMASEDEIRRAFRARAKECHPDRFPLDSSEREQAAIFFKELTIAKDTLLDPALREAYDQSQSIIQQAYLDSVVYEVPVQPKKEAKTPSFLETLKEVFREKNENYQSTDYLVGDDGPQVYNRRPRADAEEKSKGVPDASKQKAASFYYSQGLRYAARGQYRRALYALNNAKLLDPELDIPAQILSRIRAQAYYQRR